MRTIDIYCGVPRLKFDEESIRYALHIIDEDEHFPIPSGELSVAFLDDKTVTVMHGDFLDDPTSTDVITFPGAPEENFAGEICISAEYAAQYAHDHRKSLDEELMLYLVHGWLHLAGLDDRTSQTAEKMRHGEAFLLGLLRDHGALPHFEFS